jgi:acyl transferase domain-containing protein/NADPH:quinone reductase-like Zn-dependent oxidoreductase/ubiquinone/menaquinone biosynthesis C-methylase UbiE
MDILIKTRDTSTDEQLGQPICTALQIALVDLLFSWNVYPQSVVGHSSGEIAAAYAVGALSQESAIAVAYFRGLLSPKIKQSGMQGRMMAVGLSEYEAQAEINASKKELGQVVIACVNSPRSVTLSGDSDAVVTLQEGLQRKGVSAKMLQVDTAYHSHHMRMIAAEYLAALQEAGVAPLKATEQRTMFSSVTEDTIVCDALGADYWVSNLVGTVRFSQALRNLCLDNTQSTGSAASSVDVLLEVGPHALFKGPVNGVLEEAFNGASQIQYLSLLTREKPADVTALDTIGQLSSRGHPVDLHAVNFPLEGTKQPVVLTDLPRYPWNHTRSYWWESRLSRDYRFRQFPRTDILGAPVSDWNPMEPRFRNFLRLREQPWLRDHVVQGNILFPACGYISMAIEACRQMCSIAPSWLASQSSKGVSQYRLREVSISRALLIPETDDGVEVSFSMRLAASTPAALASAWHDFRVYSYTKEVGWVENCRGLVSVSSQPIADAVLAAECHCEWQEARTSTTISLNSKSFYERVDKIGLTYGPTFQGLEDVRIHNREGRASGALQVTNTRTASQKEFEHDRMLHPATLDNFLQLALAALGGANMAGLETPMVPTFIADISVSASIAAQTGDSLHVIATAQRNGAREANGDIFALDSTTSKPVVLVDGFKLIALDVSDSVSEVQAMPTYCFSAFWQPDVDLLGPYNLDRELRAAAQAGGCQGSVRQLELLSYYFIDQTLRQIGENEVNSMLPHHQRFYRNLRHLQEAVLRGAHPAQTAEWQCLDNPNVTIRMQGMIKHYRDHASAHDGKLLVRVGETLPSVLRQDVEPLALMTQGNLLESYYTTAVGMPRTYAQITRYIAMLSHKNPNLNYLEIGAGTGGATVPVLEGFTNPDGSQTQPRLQSYTYTDISSYFFERAAEKFADYTPFMDFKKLDVEHDPEAQGFEPGSCDVIVAANVLHATSDIHRTMTHVRKLLRPGGRLILLEMTNRLLAASVIFGTLPGWWNASEEWRTEGPLLTEAQWEETLRSTGFSGLQVSSPDVMDPLEEGTRLMIATAIEKTLNINNGMITPPENSQVVILCAESRTKMNCLEVPLRLRAKMEGAGFQTLLLPFSKATVEQLTAALCVSFVEFDEPMLTNPSEEEFKTIQRILEVSTRLLWVTRGAASSGSPRAELALSQGLGRTLNAENGRFSCLTIDLDNEHRLLAEEVANLLYSMVTAGYGGSDLHENADSELIERRGIFHIRRTIGDHTSNQLINARTSPDAVPPQLEPLQLQERALKLKARTSNKDGFIFENDQEHLEPLVPHEIEIEVRANSAQAKDVAFSDDVSAHHTWSRGCSGVVTRSGASTPFSVGDQVIALCTGALTTHVRISAAFAHRLPSSTTLEAGALLPLAYTTAYYCLVHLSRLEHGEYVLIHEATSPVGEAALQIATKLGAKVLMTTSNEDEKAHLLVKYGVSESAILPSLESNFVVDTRRMTEGRGVDVILNALRGEALQTSFSCMAPFGRFLELGTSSAQANERLEMSPLRRNVNFTSVDMEYLLTHKPALASEMFQSAMQFVVDHNLRISTPATTKTWSELTESVEILQGGSDLVLTCSGADRVLVSFNFILSEHHSPLAGCSKAARTDLVESQWYIPPCRGSRWLRPKYSLVACSTWGQTSDIRVTVRRMLYKSLDLPCHSPRLFHTHLSHPV